MESILKILFIEDIPTDVELAERTLAREGINFQSYTVANETDFIRNLEDSHPDIIISDYSMPEFDGMKALKISLKINPVTPFILLTGSINEETAVECLKAGAADYILKEHITRLPFAVKDALEKKKIRLKIKEDEQALKESEEKYRSFFDNSIDAILLTQPDGNILSANPAACKILGYSEEELIKFGRSCLVDLTDPRLSVLLLDRKLNGKVHGELTMIRKDGTRFPAEISSAVFKDHEGLDRTCMIIRDITEHRQGEEKMRESEMRFRSMFENSLMGISASTPEGRLIQANPAYTKMYGYENPDEMIAEVGNIGSLYANPEDRKEVLRILAEKGAMEPREMEVVRRDGTRFFLFVSAREVRDSGGKLLYYIASQIDITGNKLAAESLITSENRLHLLVQTIPDLIWLKDTGGVYLSCNTMFERFFGAKEADIIGKTDYDFINPELAEFFLEHDRKAMLAGKPTSNEEWINFADDGHRAFLETIKTPMYDAQGTLIGILGIGRDITERKMAEEALSKSEEKYRGIFENVQDVYYEALLDGTILEVSPSIEVVSKGGYHSDDLIGKFLSDFYSVTDGRQNLLSLLHEQGSVTDYEISLRNRDGSHVPCSISAKIQFDAKRTPLKIIGSMRDITERKRIEEKTNHLAAIVQSSEDAIIGKNMDGIITSWNKGAEKIYGFTENEMIGRSISFLIPPGNDDEMPAILDRLRSGEYIDHYETTRRRKDNREIQMSLTISPLRNNEGKIIAASTIGRDVTEHKKIEESLIYERNLLKSLMDNTFDNIYFKDLQSRFIRISKTQADTFGLSDPAQAIGKTDFDFFAEEHARPAYETELEIMKTGSPVVGLEEEETWPDGKVTWVLTTKVPLRGINGEIIGTFGISRDITGRKHAEEENVMLAHSLKSISECISITDMEDNIIFVNASFLKTYGYDENELIGKHISIVRSLRNAPELVKDILMTTKRGGWSGELLNKRKDGSEFPVYLSTTIINDRDGKPLGLIGVAIDITARKRAEEELLIANNEKEKRSAELTIANIELAFQIEEKEKRSVELISAKKRAEQSDKLKTEFLAQMSHEIRTPLNAIIGNVDYLYESFSKKMDSDSRDCFDGIDLASKRIIRTIDLILNIAELQTGGYKPQFVKIDLDSKILNKLFLEHQLSAKHKGLKITYTCKEKETTVMADEYSVTQIFANLIDNAVKYTKKGKVEILLGKNITGNIMVEVKDTGIGISKEFIQRIFEPFTQEEQGYTRSYEGNGLGLALVKKYCDLNNMSIEVESEKKVGSTFRAVFNKKV